MRKWNSILVSMFFVPVVAFVFLCHCQAARSHTDSALTDKVSSKSADYEITARMEFIKPIDPEGLKAPWQSALRIAETKRTVTYDIKIHPKYDTAQGIVGVRNWYSKNTSDPNLAGDLKPGFTTYWDQEMRTQLIAELAEAGILPDELDDVAFVKSVSKWLFGAGSPFTYKSFFIPYYVQFEPNAVVVPQRLRYYFDQLKKTAGLTTDDEAFQLGIFGKGMFKQHTRGDCTASSILQATVLKALGIPTRIVVNVPIADANTQSEYDMVENRLHDAPIRKIILDSLVKYRGYWSNHSFNEVFVGGKWLRLNYSNLGQPILDPNYMGLMVQVTRVRDWSEAGLTTWGLHQLDRSDGFTANPYRMLDISDKNY